MGAPRPWKAASIAVSLLLQACASPVAAPGASPPPEAAAGPGPALPSFRLEVRHLLSIGGGQFTLAVRFIPEVDPPGAGGDLYFESLSFPGAPLRAAARGRPPEIAERMKSVHSDFPGFSKETAIEILEVPQESTVLPELVILAPIDRILSFEERRLDLYEGGIGVLHLDPVDIRFSCQRSLIWMSYRRILPGDPMEDSQPWLAAGSRNLRDLLTIEDADGVPLRRQGGGLTSGIIDACWISAQTGYDGPIHFPVRVKARVPTRWERTVQRFVLKDIPIPGR